MGGRQRRGLAGMSYVIIMRVKASSGLRYDGGRGVGDRQTDTIKGPQSILKL